MEEDLFEEMDFFEDTKEIIEDIERVLTLKSALKESKERKKL
jgi:hypothetical protein